MYEEERRRDGRPFRVASKFLNTEHLTPANERLKSCFYRSINQ